MPTSTSWRRLLGAAGAAVLSLGFAGGAAAGTGAAAAAVTAGFVPAVGVHPPHQLAGRVVPGRSTGSDVVFSCQKPGAPLACYGPAQIRHAYGIDKVIANGFTGKGKTIVIIDAYQSPRIRQDLKAFDTAFGLRAPELKIVAPDGLTPFDPTDANQVGWAGEITLDVEWAHAVAPGAKIVLALARSNNDNDLLRVQQYVANHRLGDVVSQSFGEAESCFGVNADGSHQPGTTITALHKVFQTAAAKKMTVFAAAGDSGAAQPTCDGQGLKLAASTPASDPLVTGVGGTQLFANLTTGAYKGEVVWNEEEQFGSRAVGGGGFSKYFGRPGFQQGVGHLPGRGVPDISYDAAIDHGVLVAYSVNQPAGSFFIFGGTSSGSPQWAGLAAIADQKNGRDLGTINPSLYSIARSQPGAFHDITAGNNSAGGVGGFTAGTGWDAASGLGSPVANKLIPALTAAQ